MHAAVSDFVGAVGGGDFVGGTEPALADVGVFGVCRAIRGMDTFGDMMEKSPEMKAWYVSI